MDGTDAAALAVGIGTARAAVALPFGHLSAGGPAIEFCFWAGLSLLLAAAAYLVGKWWRSYGGRPLVLSLPIQRWPDFKKWDQRAEFELCEAAALWFDAEPRLPMWWRARRKFRLWMPMISSGEIPTLAAPMPVHHTKGAAHRTISSVTPHARIHRDVLRALAEKEDRKPLFLFAERRFATRQ
jgi:hypothetical protein